MLSDQDSLTGYDARFSVSKVELSLGLKWKPEFTMHNARLNSTVIPAQTMCCKYAFFASLLYNGVLFRSRSSLWLTVRDKWEAMWTMPYSP